MEFALPSVGVAAGLAVAAAYLFGRRKYVHTFQAVCFTVVGGLIPATAYALLDPETAKTTVFWLTVLLAAVLSLLRYATGSAVSTWTATIGARGLQVWLGILLASLIGYGLYLRYQEVAWYHWLAVVFGVLVGGAEILTRYKDEPWEALVSVPGVVYQAINGGIAGAAYWLVDHYPKQLFPALEHDPFMRAAVAGFGAMALMRSKLFSLKSAGGEVFAVGPDAVVTAFLHAVDRAIDRLRALKRQALVLEELDGIVYSPVIASFFQGSLAAYQNLTADEKKQVFDKIKEVVDDTKLDPQLKLIAISFGFLNISGDDNFRQLIADLKAFLKARAPTTTAVAPVGAVAAGAQAVTLRATVTSPAGPVNAGTVTFVVTDHAGAVVGAATTSATVAAGAASVVYTLPANTPAASTYTVTATYNPADLAGSKGTVPLTVL